MIRDDRSQKAVTKCLGFLFLLFLPSLWPNRAIWIVNRSYCRVLERGLEWCTGHWIRLHVLNPRRVVITFDRICYLMISCGKTPTFTTVTPRLSTKFFFYLCCEQERLRNSIFATGRFTCLRRFFCVKSISNKRCHKNVLSIQKARRTIVIRAFISIFVGAFLSLHDIQATKNLCPAVYVYRSAIAKIRPPSCSSLAIIFRCVWRDGLSRLVVLKFDFCLNHFPWRETCLITQFREKQLCCSRTMRSATLRRLQSRTRRKERPPYLLRRYTAKPPRFYPLYYCIWNALKDAFDYSAIRTCWKTAYQR